MSTLPPSDNKTKAPKPIDAFSLIEVVIAIGIVSFALLGIIGLFSATLKTNKDASAQQEGFEIQRMLLSKMQDTNQFTPTVLSNMFKTNYVFSPTRTNIFFIYNTNNISIPGAPPVTVLTNNATGYVTRNGTLYYVLILPSSNFPTNIFTKAGVNYANSDWPNWPSLPVHATVYSIPTTNPPTAAFISNSTPVISFDLTIPK